MKSEDIYKKPNNKLRELTVKTAQVLRKPRAHFFTSIGKSVFTILLGLAKNATKMLQFEIRVKAKKNCPVC